MDGPESTVYADLLLTNAQQHDETTRSNPVAHNVDSGGCYKGDASTAWQEGPPAVGYHAYLGACHCKLASFAAIFGIGDAQPILWVCLVCHTVR